VALGYKARAMQRGLDHHGEASTIGGLDVGKVVLERRVQMAPGIVDRSEDNHVAYADVMTIARQYAPRTGQTVVHPDGSFRLSRLLGDNGYNVRFVVTELAA
jgi:hypothetical protein